MNFKCQPVHIQQSIQNGLHRIAESLKDANPYLCGDNMEVIWWRHLPLIQQLVDQFAIQPRPDHLHPGLLYSSLNPKP